MNNSLNKIYLTGRWRDHWIWQNERYLKWWTDLLLSVREQEGVVWVQGRKVWLEAGQMVTSQRVLSERWICNQKTVRLFLLRLQREGMLMVHQLAPKIRIVEVCHYGSYAQGEGGLLVQSLAQSLALSEKKDCLSKDKESNKEKETQPVKEKASPSLTIVSESPQRGDALPADGVAVEQDEVGAQGGARERLSVTVEKQCVSIESERVTLVEQSTGSGDVSPCRAHAAGGIAWEEDTLQQPLEERRKAFYYALAPMVQTYGRQMVRAFYDYWSETNRHGTRMRWEMERTWDPAYRMKHWAEKETIFNHKNHSHESENTYDAAERARRERAIGAARLVEQMLAASAPCGANRG